MHQGGQLDMGCLALFAKKTIPWTPKEGVFLKVWRPRCSSKKTAPGNSRFKPTNSILQGIVCKILLGWENHWGFDYKTENHRGFLKIQKNHKFSKQKSESRTTTKMHYTMSHFFQNGTPLQTNTTSRLFSGKQERLYRDPSTRDPSLENQE